MCVPRDSLLATDSWSEHSVRDFAAGKLQAGLNVFKFQIGQFFDDLQRRQVVREQIEDITDSNPHATNARTAAALGGVDGDAIIESHQSIPPEITNMFRQPA
jgi:hypothetical protein